MTKMQSWSGTNLRRPHNSVKLFERCYFLSEWCRALGFYGSVFFLEHGSRIIMICTKQGNNTIRVNMSIKIPTINRVKTSCLLRFFNLHPALPKCVHTFCDERWRVFSWQQIGRLEYSTCKAVYSAICRAWLDSSSATISSISYLSLTYAAQGRYIMGNLVRCTQISSSHIQFLFLALAAHYKHFGHFDISIFCS